MSEQKGTLHLIATHLISALGPLVEATQDVDSFAQFMYRLGWEVEDLPSAYQDLGASIQDALDELEALADQPSLQEVLSLLETASSLYQDIQALASAPAPAGVIAADFRAEIGVRLFEVLLVEYLEEEFPALYNLLFATGMITAEFSETTTDRPGYERLIFTWERFPDLIADPDSIAASVFGWGSADLDYDLIFEYLGEFFFSLGLPAMLELAEDEHRSAYGTFEEEDPEQDTSQMLQVPFLYRSIDGVAEPFGLRIIPLPADDSGSLGIAIEPLVPSEFEGTFRITDEMTVALRAGTEIGELFGLMIRPENISVKYPFAEGESLPDTGFGLILTWSPAEPVLLLGNSGESRLQLEGAEIRLDVDWVGSDLAVGLSATLQGLSIILSAGESDRFIQSLLQTDEETTIGIQLGIEWTSTGGVKFTGGGGFEVEVYPRLTIGPVSVDAVQLAVVSSTGAEPTIETDVGVSLSGELGPLQFAVEGIGFKATLNFTDGNAGPFDVNLGFKAPTGVALSIDSQGFAGGGFLYFDDNKKEYSGGLELEFKGTISIKAIGILTTEMPDGSDGFSLLLIITSEFTPIQLGFGFTLNGVGGLAGINRTCEIDVLQTGVKDGTLDNILFPQDIVANATEIVTDVAKVFPALDDQYVFGPMGELGWGTPTLITVQLGLLIEIPDPIRMAILGVLKTLLPDETFKLLSIQVNFLGVIDLENGTLSFDASLYDSSLLTFSLTGDMALRLNWGDDPVFVLSVGGFHPSYDPPANLGISDMERLSISLFPSDNPKLTIETYFAVTSNTVQFGAKGELYVGVSKFDIEGSIGFDVLFQFDPFYFVMTCDATLAVSAFGEEILSIDLSLTLDGPTPWHGNGTASFKVLLVKVKVKVNVTVGDEKNTTLEPKDVAPLLEEEFAKTGNWTAEMPDESNLQVTLGTIDTSGGKIIAHPCGILAVSQKLVPLDLTISKFGNQSISGDDYFSISSVEIGSQSMAFSETKEEFAPAQYFELSDAEKLSSADFEEYNSGVSIDGSGELKADYVAARDLEYELKYLYNKSFSMSTLLNAALFSQMLKNSAVSKSKLSTAINSFSVLGTQEVAVNSEQFTITSVDNLSLYKEEYVFSSEREAKAKMEELVNDDPSLKSALQVTPAYEIA